MIRLIWTLSAYTRDYLRRNMPTNRLLDAIRRRRNLKWGIPATRRDGDVGESLNHAAAEPLLHR